MGVKAAPARLGPGPRRAPQIAPPPFERTRRSSLISPSLRPSKRACLLVGVGTSLDVLSQAFLEVVPEYLVLVLMINSYGARQRMPRRESSPVPRFVKDPESDIEAIYARTQNLR